jgi:hypothetical protein
MVVQDGALSAYLIVSTGVIVQLRREERTGYRMYRAPDKGEVGGSSPPRPTIKIASKYAAILTFPLPGNISQKTNLPTICQL